MTNDWLLKKYAFCSVTVHMSLMVDRLELCAKEVGLKFTAGHPDGSIFIGSDMFYVEVQLEASSGKVKDVLITQGADTVVRRNTFHAVVMVTT